MSKISDQIIYDLLSKIERMSSRQEDMIKNISHNDARISEAKKLAKSYQEEIKQLREGKL